MLWQVGARASVPRCSGGGGGGMSRDATSVPVARDSAVVDYRIYMRHWLIVIFGVIPLYEAGKFRGVRDWRKPEFRVGELIIQPGEDP